MADKKEKANEQRYKEILNTEMVRRDGQVTKKDISYEEWAQYFLEADTTEDNEQLYKDKFKLMNLAIRALIDKKIIKDNSVLKHSSLAELPVQDGLFLERVKPQFSSVTGLEISKNWNKYALKKKRSSSLIDPTEMSSITDNAFDFVFAYKLFGRVADNKLALQELLRIAKRAVIIINDDLRNRKKCYTSTYSVSQFKYWIMAQNKFKIMYTGKNPTAQNDEEQFYILLEQGLLLK